MQKHFSLSLQSLQLLFAVAFFFFFYTKETHTLLQKIKKKKKKILAQQGSTDLWLALNQCNFTWEV